jgi:hypothetical protein
MTKGALSAVPPFLMLTVHVAFSPALWRRCAHAGMTHLSFTDGHRNGELSDFAGLGYDRSDEVTAAVAWTDAAQLPSGQPLPTQGMNRLRVGPDGLLEEHLFIAPDEGWSSPM